MKNIFLLFLTLSIAFSQTIKFATVAPKGSAWSNVLEEFSKAVTTETKGRVKFKIYMGGTQGDEITAIKRLRLNQIQSGGFIGPGLGQILPEVRVLDLPFLFQNYQEIDYVLEKMLPYFREKFAAENYQLLAWSEAGIVNVFSSMKILNYDDIKKTKMFSLSGDPIADITFEALQLSPTRIPLTDVLTSLETGDINTTYTPPLGAVSLQWYRKQKYFINVNLAYSSGAVIIRMDKWMEISEEDRNTINRLAIIYFEKFKQVGRESNSKSIDVIKKEGLEEIKINNLQPFINAGLNARKKAVGKLFSLELLQKIEALIEESHKK